MSIKKRIEQRIQAHSLDRTYTEQGTHGIVCLFSDALSQQKALCERVRTELIGGPTMHRRGIAFYSLTSEEYKQGVMAINTLYEERSISDRRFVLAVFLYEDEALPCWFSPSAEATCVIIRIVQDYRLRAAVAKARAEYQFRAAGNLRHLKWVLLLERRGKLQSFEGVFALECEQVDGAEMRLAQELYKDLHTMSGWRLDAEKELTDALKKSLERIGALFQKSLPAKPNLRDMPIERGAYDTLIAQLSPVSAHKTRRFLGFLSAPDKNLQATVSNLEQLFGKYNGDLLIHHYYAHYLTILDTSDTAERYRDIFDSNLSCFYDLPYAFILDNYQGLCESEISKAHCAISEANVKLSECQKKTITLRKASLPAIYEALSEYAMARLEHLQAACRHAAWRLAKRQIEQPTSALYTQLTEASDRISDQRETLLNMGARPITGLISKGKGSVSWAQDICDTLPNRNIRDAQLDKGDVERFYYNLRGGNLRTAHEDLLSQVLLLYSSPMVDSLLDEGHLRHDFSKREWLKTDGVGSEQIIALMVTPIAAYEENGHG